LDAALTASVRARLVADVPLGAFLSGGIDSSLVVALMGRHHDGPVRTLTIGFADEAFAESPFAREVARVLGPEHADRAVTPAEARSAPPGRSGAYTGPSAGRARVPTVRLARRARRDGTVALSGDGGDELFAGYWHRLWRLEPDEVPEPPGDAA